MLVSAILYYTKFKHTIQYYMLFIFLLQKCFRKSEVLHFVLS